MSCTSGPLIDMASLVIDLAGNLPATTFMVSIATIKFYRSRKILNVVAMFATIILGSSNLSLVALNLTIKIMGESRPESAYKCCLVLVPLGYIFAGSTMACCLIITFEKVFRSHLSKSSQTCAKLLVGFTVLFGGCTIGMIASAGWILGFNAVRVVLSACAFWVASVEGFVGILSVFVLRRLRKKWRKITSPYPQKATGTGTLGHGGRVVDIGESECAIDLPKELSALELAKSHLDLPSPMIKNRSTVK
ncbi:hypothetical protein BJ742DRAFT_843478, partial [Cladochytrium replicatum]